MKRSAKKRLLTIIIADLLCFLLFSFGVCIIVFDLFGGERDLMGEAKTLATPPPAPTKEPPAATDVPQLSPENQPTTTNGGEAPSVPTKEPISEPTQEPTQEPQTVASKFADKFVTGEPVVDKDVYRSDRLAIEIRHIEGAYCDSCQRVSATPGTCSHCGASIKKANKQIIRIAEVFTTDTDCFGSYGVSSSKDVGKTAALAKRNNAILAANSDYYLNAKTQGYGWFVRNNVEIARYDKIASDLCILYSDGSMDTIDYKNDAYDVEEIYAKYPKHIWYFGPVLLDSNGQAKKLFNLHGPVADNNPRMVLGYYEPGHYAFVLVEGDRGKCDSRGLSLEELSRFCQELGFAKAYNMDGGGSAALYFNGTVYGPDDRSTSDIMFFFEPDNAQ